MWTMNDMKLNVTVDMLSEFVLSCLTSSFCHPARQIDSCIADLNKVVKCLFADRTGKAAINSMHPDMIFE